jgi:hypothetical protein
VWLEYGSDGMPWSAVVSCMIPGYKVGPQLESS